MIVSTRGVPLMVVGAGARLLRLDWAFALNSPRTTRDGDLAVEVPDIDADQQLRRAVSDPGARLEAGSVRVQVSGVRIDVLPYGPIETAAGIVRWDEMELDMCGLADARAGATPLVVGDGLRLDVPTIPAFVAMKLIAVEARGPHDPRDFRDLHFIASVYDRCGNDARLFDELGASLAAGTLSFEYAGAFLLGRDVAAQASPRTVARARVVLDRIVADHEALARVLFGVPLDEEAEVANCEQVRGRCAMGCGRAELDGRQRACDGGRSSRDRLAFGRSTPSADSGPVIDDEVDPGGFSVMVTAGSVLMPPIRGVSRR